MHTDLPPTFINVGDANHMRWWNLGPKKFHFLIRIVCLWTKKILEPPRIMVLATVYRNLHSCRFFKVFSFLLYINLYLYHYSYFTLTKSCTRKSQMRPWHLCLFRPFKYKYYISFQSDDLPGRTLITKTQRHVKCINGTSRGKHCFYCQNILIWKTWLAVN